LDAVEEKSGGARVRRGGGAVARGLTEEEERRCALDAVEEKSGGARVRAEERRTVERKKIKP
jgi:hypothetical protein